MATTRLIVNGTAHDITAAPQTPLLYVLRNDLGLSGPKFACGLGQCGACTVHIDGVAVPSCNTTIENAARGPITTIEGLGTAEKPHPVQRAFIDEQAAQCGYCANGMIMAAAALIAHESADAPTDSFVAQWQSLSLRHTHADHSSGRTRGGVDECGAEREARRRR